MLVASLLHALAAAAVAVWAVQCAWEARHEWRSASSLAQWSRTRQGVGVARVDRAPWSLEAVEAAMAARRPTVFENSPSAAWPAASRWTPAFLAAAVPTLRKVQVSEGRAAVWRYMNRAPWEGVEGLGLPRSAFETAAEMRTDEFFRACDRGAPTVYYAGDLGRPRALLDDLGTPAALGLAAGNGSDVLSFVWLGCDGVAAHAHTDGHYNLFAQLRGSKRFLLLPPSAGPLVFPYPRMHPGRGQSAVDWERPDARLHAEFAEPAAQRRLAALARVAVLRPGDLLFVPPMWWHAVATLEQAVSVSMWRKDEAAEAFGRLADGVAVPVRRSWGVHERAAAAAAFLSRVLAACPRPDGEAPLRHLLRVRYREVRDAPAEVLPRAGDGGGAVLHACAPPGEADAARVRAEAARAAALVGEVVAADADAAVEYVLDYCEELAAAAVGARRVRQFFEELDALGCVVV